MSEENLNCLIDLGSKKIKCSLFKYEDDQSKLIAFYEKETKGIHNSIIINFNEASNSIRSVVSEIEKQANLNINKISVLIEPIETLVTHLTKFKKMEGSKIEKEDINFLLRESKKQIEKNDKNMTQIHMFNSKYLVDNKIFHEIPINIFCDQLSLENTFISIPKNILKNISEVFHNCELKIDRFISSSYANILNLFNESNLKQGCGVVDIGYEKISIGLFKNFSLYKILIFPIGSNHITKDVSKICYLNEHEAEIIKLDTSLFTKKNDNENNIFLSDKFFVKSKFRKISMKFIKDVVNSRVKEIIKLIFKELKNIDGFQIIKNNLVFVGEGSKVINLGKILNDDFKNVDFSVELDNSYVQNKAKENMNKLTCHSGQNLLVNGWSKEAIATAETNQKKGLFTRFFEIFN